MKTKKTGEEDPRYSQAMEADDLHQEIRLQIQVVVKETAKLTGLLTEGLRKTDIDSPEYRTIKKQIAEKALETGKRWEEGGCCGKEREKQLEVDVRNAIA